MSSMSSSDRTMRYAFSLTVTSASNGRRPLLSKTDCSAHVLPIVDRSGRISAEIYNCARNTLWLICYLLWFLDCFVFQTFSLIMSVVNPDLLPISCQHLEQLQLPCCTCLYCAHIVMDARSASVHVIFCRCFFHLFLWPP